MLSLHTYTILMANFRGSIYITKWVGYWISCWLNYSIDIYIILHTFINKSLRSLWKGGGDLQENVYIFFNNNQTV